ncbi:MAG: cytochrome C biogenesis protein [Actinomycetota bacterium]|nr:cytochrome C biogenesis protein [Actinomycetota bacterium]MDH4017634.1 cytochrome C biogenesis protein [Actinomycetota bacterium]
MIEIFGALIAGVLTTLAPCVLPLLPVIVGGSMAGAASEVNAEASSAAGTATATRTKTRSAAVTRALVITASLGVSILVFTLALKATTALIGIPPQTWQWVSGGILIALGIVGAFPDLWERFSARLGLQARSAQRLGSARRHDGLGGEVLTGAALGPVFTSCSPLYGYVIVTVLPAEPARGLLLLGVYIVGLCATLLLIALAGQRVVARFGWAADSHGWFRRTLGFVFIAVGVLVATGWMKSLESWLVVNAPWAPWNLDSSFIGG